MLGTQLAEYNFEVCYKPGRLHTNADALSRIPSREEPEKDDDSKDFIRLGADEVRACLWPAKKIVQEEPEGKAAVQASVRREISGYSWSEIGKQQRNDPVPFIKQCLRIRDQAEWIKVVWNQN